MSGEGGIAEIQGRVNSLRELALDMLDRDTASDEEHQIAQMADDIDALLADRARVWGEAIEAAARIPRTICPGPKRRCGCGEAIERAIRTLAAGPGGSVVAR